MLNAHIKDDFRNLLEYREWVNRALQSLSPENQARMDEFSEETVNTQIVNMPNWFGPDTSFEELSSGITQYKRPELIQQIYDKVNDKISTLTRNKIKSKKLEYNASGLGVFVFDRASMGLFRLKEFYSPSHKKTFDNKEIKSSRRGYTLIKDNTPIIERWEQKSDGKPKIRTSNKKVFAWFPPSSKEKRAVELFVGCGGTSRTTAEQLLYSGISAIIVAQLLEQAHIPTKITIALGSSPDTYEKAAYAALIPVKNYDERLDMNLLALLTSDPRFFRFEGLKGYLCLYDHFGVVIPDNFGHGLGRSSLKKIVEESGYADRTKLAPNRYYFGRTIDEGEAIEHITETIDDLSNKLNQ
ncbi:hypothetical protein KK083_03430 [Fulvivirgaceae bacterium PWU4]|uniref:Uncharacterized protein n=1 Tax=Chryseosolibacter histidini TaxID=2782349 RepID=A0AAP2DGE4_9BACT|nr:hypothetical protein [Chryseosolibacter histidini]MBT1695913.1 hypothetical protein [Chryseosolibacter histidini]